MSGLPPLNSLFALYCDSPIDREIATRDMTLSGDFDKVWQPIPGWIVGARALPWGADLDTGSEPSIVCAEGLHRLLGMGTDAPTALSRVVRLASERPNQLGSIPGDFTFIHLSARGRATAVRSCSGRVPLFCHSTQDRSAVATRLDYLVRYLPHHFELDPLATSVWLSGHRLFLDERSHFSGVKVLQAGNYARLDPGRATTSRRYWDPRPRKPPRWSEEAMSEHAGHLRELLLQGLSTELSATGENLFFMGGGVDSTALGTLASRTLRRPVSTVTLLPTEVDELEHELAYITPLRRELPLHTTVDVVFTTKLKLALARSMPDTVFPYESALNIIDAALAEMGNRPDVVVSGMFADEVTGSRRQVADWFAATPLPTLLRLKRNVPTAHPWRHWVSLRLRRILRKPPEAWPRALPDFVRHEVALEYQAWRRDRRRRLAADESPAPMLFAAMQCNGWLVDLWEASSIRGARPLLPFYNREVLELAFACHPHEKLDSGTKKLLRRALQADVPEHNLSRPDKGLAKPVRDDSVLWQDAWPSEVATFLSPTWMHGPPRTFNSWHAGALLTLIHCIGNHNRRRQARQ